MFSLLIITCSLGAAGSVSLEELWATDKVFKEPEGIAIDYQREVVYVSNVNAAPWELDGNGFVSKIGLDGSIIELEWVKGFHSPKGLGIKGDFLFVADVDGVVMIDIATGKRVKKLKADPSLGLNDITISKDGAVYVSGSNSSRILKVGEEKLELFMKDDFERPNGLFVRKNRLLVLTSGGSTLYAIQIKSKKKKVLATDLGHGDGIVPAGQGGHLASDWKGRVFYLDKDFAVTTLLDTREQEINAADIAYHIRKNILFVPTFFDDRVVAYKLKRTQ
jgi:DNA-binding beta-propeller fold protein YncE